MKRFRKSILIVMMVQIILMLIQPVSAATNTLTFPLTESIWPDEPASLTSVGSKLVFFEPSPKKLTVKYINKSTLKIEKTFVFATNGYDRYYQKPLFAEGYFIIGLRSGSGAITRYAINAGSGKKTVLPQNLKEYGNGYVYDNSLFIFANAIFDFKRNYWNTDINVLSGVNDARLLYSKMVGNSLQLYCFKTKTLKAEKTFKIGASPEHGSINPNIRDKITRVLYSNGYYVFHVNMEKDGTNFIDRYVINANTGSLKLLSSHVPDSSGSIFKKDIFVFDDAVYDFNSDFSLTGISRSYNYSGDADSNNYIYRLADKYFILNMEKLTSKALPDGYNDERGAVLLASDIYGMVYVMDMKLYWQKLNGENHLIGPVSSLQYFQFGKIFGLNSEKNAMYVVDSPGSYYLLDLEAGSYSKNSMPEQLYGLIFKPGSKEIALAYDCEGVMRPWIMSLYLKDETGAFVLIDEHVDFNISFFKHYLVFPSEMEGAGHYEAWSNAITVYDMDTGGKSVFESSHDMMIDCRYVITDNKLYVSIRGYLDGNFKYESNMFQFNEQDGKLLSVDKFKEPVGYGIYMAKGAYNTIDFYDGSNHLLESFWNSVGPVCIFNLGSKDGFLYDGNKLIPIHIPEQVRSDYTIRLFENRYLMYYYPMTANKAQSINVRIVDLLSGIS